MGVCCSLSSGLCCVMSVMSCMVMSHGCHRCHGICDGCVELIGRSGGGSHARDAVKLLSRIHFHWEAHLLMVHCRLMVVVVVVVVSRH